LLHGRKLLQKEMLLLLGLDRFGLGPEPPNEERDPQQDPDQSAADASEYYDESQEDAEDTEEDSFGSYLREPGGDIKARSDAGRPKAPNGQNESRDEVEKSKETGRQKPLSSCDKEDNSRKHEQATQEDSDDTGHQGVLARTG
jgi:hypothetical protein